MKKLAILKYRGNPMYNLYTLCSHWFIFGTLQLICVFCIYLILARKSSVREDIVVYMEDHKITSAGVFALCLLISLFSNPNFYRFVGYENIRTMPEGEYCYYVEVNREIDDQIYTFPAKVKVSKDEYTSYHLSEVYFSNGGYLRVNNEELDIDEPFSFIDQDGDYWDCSFINNRCSDAPFAEDNDVPAKYTVRLSFNLLILTLAYISLLRDVKENEAESKKWKDFHDYLTVAARAKAPAPERQVSKETSVSAPVAPPPQKQSVPFVADAGRGNAIWPILLTVLGGIVLVLIIAVVIIACE